MENRNPDGTAAAAGGNRAGAGRRLLSVLSRKWHGSGPLAAIFRNMALLTSGAMMARVVAAGSAPFITRIYTPEHMGVLSVFASLAAMLIPFVTLAYSTAIPLPKRDGMALNLALLCGALLLTISPLVLVFFLFFSEPVLQALHMERLLPYWWLLPVAIIGTGLYEIVSHWAVRDKAFKSLAQTQVWQSVIGAVSKIGLGLLGLKPLGLLIGQILMQSGGSWMLFRRFRRNHRGLARQVSLRRMGFLLRRYADFPKYRLPSQFLLSFSSKAPLLFFAWHHGAEATGQFGLALMIMALPMALLGHTIGQAYYAEIAKVGRKRPEAIYQITRGITRKLFWISVPPFLILLLSGPWLFQLVFGDVWRTAGVFASIMSVYLLTQFVSSPIVSALNVFGKQTYYFQMNLLRVVFMVAPFLAGWWLELSQAWTLVLYSLSMSALRFYLYFKIMAIIREQAPGGPAASSP